jgi:hypothetical protein
LVGSFELDLPRGTVTLRKGRLLQEYCPLHPHPASMALLALLAEGTRTVGSDLATLALLILARDHDAVFETLTRTFGESACQPYHEARLPCEEMLLSHTHASHFHSAMPPAYNQLYLLSKLTTAYTILEQQFDKSGCESALDFCYNAAMGILPVSLADVRLSRDHFFFFFANPYISRTMHGSNCQ